MPDSSPQPSKILPSGEQHEIASGNQVAVISEVGATLRSYQVGGRDIIDGFAADECASGGRSQILCPWPNRLRDGKYVFKGVQCQAAIDEPAFNNAIHGLVRWNRWQLVQRAQNRAKFEYIIFPQPGFRWTLKILVTYTLSVEGIVIETEAINVGELEMPFGIGFHPYLKLDPNGIDSLYLTIPAKRRLISDSRMIPIGSETVDGTLYDFSQGAPLGGVTGISRLDTCFFDLIRDENGISRCRLESEGKENFVELWADRSFSYYMIYTGDTLASIEERRRSVAIEPMSCPPNALQSLEDIVTLAPGSSWFGKWGIHSSGTR